MLNTTFANRYKILKKLGVGGFATVYLAKDNKTGVEVAIKIYNQLDTYGMQIFQQEYAKLAHLGHQRLLKAEHFDSWEDQPFLVLPYCKEGSLTKHLVSHKQDLSEEQIARIIFQIAEGLEYLHKKGIVHRDLKPDNVLYKDSDDLVISDFGVSQSLNSTLSKSIKATAKQAMLGYTQAYAPPTRELIKIKSEGSFDIFSFGIMIYELAMKDLPFMNTARAVEHGEPIPDLSGPYSQRLGQLIRLCLDEEPEKRPTATQLKKLANHFIEQKHWPNVLEGSKHRSPESAHKKLVKLERIRFGIPKIKLEKKHGLIGAAAVLVMCISAWAFWSKSPTWSSELTHQYEWVPTNELDQWLDDNNLELLLKTANSGHPVAQRRLGRLYLNGVGKSKDYIEALRWIRKAVDQEDAGAQFTLGWMFFEGLGVSQDHQEAVKWYRLAADQGYASAQNGLGYAYMNGQGVSQDHQEAVKWYRLAADQGFASAQNNLGYVYSEGQGVSQDHQESVKWYRLAADQGNATAQFNLGKAYYDGEGVSKDYQEAVKWYRLAADQGDASAQYSLGYAYMNGRGVSQDHQEAVKWYRLAVDQGNTFAQNGLGYAYMNGQGVSQDHQEAVKWYRLAADQGNAAAQFNLGKAYYDGKGVSKDYQEAVKWFRLAADQGDSSAQFILGNAYYEGKGVSKDYQEAVKWFKIACENGYQVACKELYSNPEQWK